MSTYSAIGIMSGSSLDGVDIAYCRFDKNEKWHFKIVASQTYPLGNFKEKLVSAREESAVTLYKLDAAFGKFLGELCLKFLSEFNLTKPNLISSHGHTIFHFPEEGTTCQIGSGEHIAEITGCTVVSDLRMADIAAGGSGAPIVPIGDQMLFSEYQYCLNIGGIANISHTKNKVIKAYDICAANQILNYFAQKSGMDYDHCGNMAKSGILNHEMLEKLNSLDYYKIAPPKSLDNGFSKIVLNIIERFNESPGNVLRTYTEHMAQLIAKSVESTDAEKSKMLVTGGGAHNTFLMERISDLCPVEVVVPDNKTIDFKEALVMAFIGVLRMRNEVNCLASVTGAKHDTVGGRVSFARG